MTVEIKPIETRFDGRLFRSRTEARWAALFKSLDVPYEYEKEGFDLSGRWYLPDFYLPDMSIWLEVKGQEPTGEESALCVDLARNTGKIVALVVGQPRPEEAQWIVFSPSTGRVDRRYTLLADRRHRALWLAWIKGDVQMESFVIRDQADGAPHDRLPLMMDWLAEAYEAALSEHF